MTWTKWLGLLLTGCNNELCGFMTQNETIHIPNLLPLSFYLFPLTHLIVVIIWHDTRLLVGAELVVEREEIHIEFFKNSRVLRWLTKCF
jgi:hypothetical protein